MKPATRRKWLRGAVGLVLLITAHVTSATTPEIADGVGHTLAVDRFGNTYAWGNNSQGQLGDGTTNPSLVPIIVPSLSGTVDIAAGGAGSIQGFSLAVRSDGVVFGWGYNGDGQLGLGNTNTGPMIPTQLPSFPGVLTVSAGAHFAVALKKDGSVWAWGLNDHGQLGQGDNFPSSSPLQVTGVSNIVKVVAGDAHVLALRADGAIFAWGLNAEGEVGNNSQVDSLVPVQVGLPTGAIDIAASVQESWAALPDGSVYGFGRNSAGQVGDLTTVSPRLTPTRARGFLPRTVKLGRANAFGEAVQAHAFDGRLWKWGYGGLGQMGDGYQPNVNPVPQMLSGLVNQTVMVSSSGQQSHLVRTNGVVVGWGENAVGPGETGTSTASPPPNVLTPAPVFGVGGTGELNLGNFSGRKSNFSGLNNLGWLLWRLPSVGANTLWGINANFVVINMAITAVGPTWSVAGTGDLNGDGMPTLYGSRPAAPSSCGR
jgi:alpha-tubulin suppressor-like RCC1 family protein